MYKLIVMLLGGLWLVPVMATQYPQADVNGYTSQYDIQVYDSSEGDTLESGRSGYDVASLTCDRTVTTGDSSWAKIESNDGAYDVFCVRPGDHRSKGTLTLNACGGSRCWLILEDNGFRVHDNPWDMTLSDRARTKSIRIDADNWVIANIWVDTGSGEGLRVDADDLLVHNVVVEAGELTTHDNAVSLLSGADDITIQNSVIYNCARNTDADNAGVSINSPSSNVRLVNSEVFDCTDQLIAGGSSSEGRHSGLKVENSDLYFTEDVYLSGGDLMCAENHLDIKNGGTGPSNGPEIVHNRLWGARPADGSAFECGGTGDRGGASVLLQDWTDYAYVHRNIFYDNQRNFSYGGGPDEFTHNNTFEANLIYGWRQYYAGQTAFAIRHTSDADTALSWFNTLANGANQAESYWMDAWGGNSAFRCNLVVDGRNVDRNDTDADYTALIGDSDSPGGTGNVSYSTSGASLGDYTYYRKLITGPELMTVEGVTVTTDSPAALKSCDGGRPNGYGHYD